VVPAGGQSIRPSKIEDVISGGLRPPAQLDMLWHSDVMSARAVGRTAVGAAPV